MQPDGYRCRFGTIWTLVLIEIFGTLATLVVCIWALANESPHYTLAIIGIVLCVLSIALIVGAFFPKSQLRFRAGSGVFGAIFGTLFERSSRAPTTTKQVIALFEDERNEAQRNLTPVGGAWSCSLAHRFLLPFPRVYMHRLAGNVEGYTWLAGTPLKTVQNELAKEGRQLIGVPSSSYVTLGAWVATLAHGNSGATFKPLPLVATVLDKKTGVVSNDSSQMLLDKFGSSEERAQQFVVLAVTLPASIPVNQSLRRSARRVKTIEDTAWFLKKDTLMRALFVGQTAALGMTWTPLRPGDSKPGGANVLDKLRTLALAGLGWGAPDPRGREAQEKVSDAVFHFPDTILSIQHLVQVWLSLVNAEFFIQLSVDAQSLLNIVRALQQTHATIGGRTELRVDGSVVYFDVAMRESQSNFETYFATLRELGVKQVAQHRGKHRRERAEMERAGLKPVDARDIL